jgi:hypothetical protein
MRKQKLFVQNAGVHLSQDKHKPQLKLDWCSHAAAKYSVEHWHYSRSLPTPPLVKIGVWEDERFIGCVLFSRGANQHLGSPYGQACTEVCELTRVALDQHKTPVSRIVAIAIKMLQLHVPGLRLIVSFADPNEGHVGTIYQAGGWIDQAQTSASYKYQDKQGRIWHARQVSSTGLKRQYGETRRMPKISDCVKLPELGKHRYLFPLDKEMRTKVQALSKPYPKKSCAASIEGDASGDPARRGSFDTTAALQEQSEEAST